MNSLGERIAYYRKKSGLTQEQLAEKCSVTAQAVSKWENDLTAPDISLIPALAKIFNVSCDELLGVVREGVIKVEPELIDLNKTLLKIKADSEDGDKLSVNLPLSIAEVLLQSGVVDLGDNAKMLKGIQFNQIIAMVRQGVIGKILEAQSAEGDKIEIWVE